MATTTRRRRKASDAAEPEAAAAAPAAAPAEESKEDPKEVSKRKASERAAQDKNATDVLLKRTGEHPRVPNREAGDDEPIADVARDLKITAGKAAYLLMKDAVAKGKVPAIEGDDDDELVKNITVERAKADQYSSWGWLSARSGQPETWIKAELEDAGKYAPRAENISSVRAAKREAEKPAEADKPAAAAAESADGEAPKRRRRRAGNAS